MNQSFQQIKEESTRDFNELVEGVALNKEHVLRFEKFFTKTFDNVERIFLLVCAENSGIKRIVDNCRSAFQERFDNSLKVYLEIRVKIITWALAIISALLLTIWTFYTVQIMGLSTKMDKTLLILQDHSTRISVLEVTGKRINNETIR
jgi:hypothetical protein